MTVCVVIPKEYPLLDHFAFSYMISKFSSRKAITMRYIYVYGYMTFDIRTYSSNGKIAI